MPKQSMPRKTKTSDGPARSRRGTPAPEGRPEGNSHGPTPFQEEIAARAYELYLARGRRHGDDWADWFQAEADVLGRKAKKGRTLGS